MKAPRAAAMHSRIDIAAGHPAFAGHFPGFPVLPGAVLLDEALQAIERARGIDLTRWRVSSAKFLGAVRPGDALLLEHDAAADGTIRYVIRAAEVAVASGSLSPVTA